jgi:hypothetical protein
MLEKNQHAQAAAAHDWHFGKIEHTVRAAFCAMTVSRSLKTSSLRVILPLHSTTVKSLSFSTFRASMGNPPTLVLEARDLPKVDQPSFQFDTERWRVSTVNFREVTGESVHTENAVFPG